MPTSAISHRRVSRPQPLLKNSSANVFLARDARRVSEPASGDLEEIEVVTAPRAQITQVLRRGEIVQLSSAAAIALATVLLGRDQ